MLVVYALLSWFPGGYQSPLGRIFARICEPYLSIFDRWNLRFGPVDFTIMAAILLLNFASRGLVILIGTFL